MKLLFDLLVPNRWLRLAGWPLCDVATHSYAYEPGQIVMYCSVTSRTV